MSEMGHHGWSNQDTCEICLRKDRDALLEQNKALEEKLKRIEQFGLPPLSAFHSLEAERDRYKAALEKIAKKQPEVLAMLRRYGFVFELKGGRWENLAFMLYTDICEEYSIAQSALAQTEGA